MVFGLSANSFYGHISDYAIFMIINIEFLIQYLKIN
jgi:hypothetical protein